MDLLQLPQDIWVLILDLLTQADALQLARVNRAAHCVAMPRVLYQVELRWERAATREHPRPQRSGAQVVSFASLIMGNPDAYAHHVKSLIIHWSPNFHLGEHYLASKESVKALRHVSSVRQLTLTEAEFDCGFSSEVVDVMASQDRLQCIRLEQFDKIAISLLERTVSRLREVVLVSDMGRGDGLFDFDYLRPHAETLEVFRMFAYRFECPLSDGDTWTRVHTLEIQVADLDFPSLVITLAHAFPHVRCLSLKTFMSHLDGAVLEPLAWPSLDVVNLSRVCLNLVTPVRVVCFDSLTHHAFPPRFLEYTQPAVLSLHLDYVTLHTKMWFHDLLTPKGLRSLRYLQLRWATMRNADPMDSEAMDTIKQLAELGLHLHAISLCHHPIPSGSDWEDADSEAPASRERMAKSIAPLFPTVELVGLGHHENALFSASTPLVITPTIWYRVRRVRDNPGDEIIVEAAHPEETAEINRYVKNLGRSAT
ncbi:hypothetical protein OH76DRAFT_824677 [Lentinus brumalis]|uniref:F-box domain-containing protein n=1 Tax=Lentinus brumalis TaxID=2498619 RepID=A0A371D258_9APHY|nr:hypothetical protein OH76DRAFT_824677 [Polyporus brumalis]